ncbi:MAG: transcription-repair coupling factor [Chloroflexi bacterium]|nr:transcription-repair coupling factor [Chloroflexota bacterium]MDA1147047.1 transcription-repair coupling factor [Chloroflexota bacterium]
MDLSSALPLLQAVEPLTEVYSRLDAGERVTLGMPDSAKAVTAALLWRRHRKPTLLIVAREVDAQSYAEQLSAWTGGRAMLFPSHGTMPYQREAPDAGITAERLRVLAEISNPTAGPPLVIASVASAVSHTLAPADLSRGAGTVASGESIGLDQLARRLVAAGYDIGPLVELPGQAARRGGLVDVFPPILRFPVRIEFFGDEVESIRVFDPDTQRTVEHLDRIAIGPAREWYAEAGDLVRLAARLGRVDTDAAEEEVASLRRGQLAAPDRYGPLASEATLLDHLQRDALVLIDERETVEAAASDQDDLTEERRADLAKQQDLDPDAPLPHATRNELVAAIEGHPRRVELARWATGREPGAFRLPFGTADAYAGRLPAAAGDHARQLARRDRVVVVTQQAQRYTEVLAENGVPAAVQSVLPEAPDGGSLSLLQGALPEGWTIATPRGIVSLTTDRELFGFVKQRRQLRKRATHRSQFLAEVRPGDFVVHADHGIARFGGIVRRPVGDEDRDYLELRYADEDRIYVPVEQVDKVSRYSGPSGHAPRLTRLGTQEWTRARARVKAAVSIVAADLVRLYAARQMLQGHAFGEDTAWQGELEAAFPYEETEDQLAAIVAVKADMQSEQPMDRVICGDVGFGKTEVAVRAAFKAVQEGYQVAVLVPTTVLAQQHLNTFRERVAGFPVTVDVLSRFRTDSEAAEVIARTGRGEIDILIGTHRMLDPNIQFQNLGLVIIDEEQRFGVTHKERLKRMRLEVDVLTLSATPIPRTMHMALSGIRDMSTIDTPPETRQAVQTYVTEWDEAIVREAILHEVERGGQVYVVHNRVRTIDAFADHIREMVPEARVVIGHGQMPPSILENVMSKFADAEFDVLVCTTIIESGIDIANVNTMIVDRADRLGLAQMYQLRGRVGRGSNQAYAYLMHPKDSVLNEVAQQRLSTIFEASELGAGFQVALRDLEIRGAGNLLGAEQSGNIATVGFDLYTQMLAEAVEELKASHENRERAPLQHEKQRDLRQVVIDLPVASFIPEPYIEEIDGRLALYQRISALTDRAAADLLEQETADRFGEIPEPLAHLFQLVRLRLAAAAANLGSIRMDGDELVLTAAGRPFSSRTLPRLPSGVRRGATQLRLERRALGREWLEPLDALVRLLGDDAALAPTGA